MQPPKLKPALELSLPSVLADTERLGATQHAVLAHYDETAPRLLRYAQSFGVTDEAAEDIVQEAFLALFRHLCLGRSSHGLTGWLFRVTRNLALKHRQRGTATEFMTDVLLERIADPGHTPEERLAFDERCGRLRSVVRALDSRARHCLYLRAEGLSYRDIASALGISLGSVAQCLARAFARLTIVDRL